MAIRLSQDIRLCGRVPQSVRGSAEDQVRERNLAKRLHNAKASKLLTPECEAELQQIGDAPQLADDVAMRLKQDIRLFGRISRGIRGSAGDRVSERNLAKRLHNAKKDEKLTPTCEAKLAGLKERSLGQSGEVGAPPDPLDPFVDDAENRLEQDLLMMSNGVRSRPLQRRMRRYRKHVSDPAWQNKPVVQMCKEQVNASSSTPAGLA